MTALDRSPAKDPNSPEYAQASRVVDAVMAGTLPNNTNGATHFFSPSGQAALGADGRRQVPTWAVGHTADVGGNSFFAPNDRVTFQAKPQGALASASPVSFGGSSSGQSPAGDAGGLSDDDLDAMLSGKSTPPAAGGTSYDLGSTATATLCGRSITLAVLCQRYHILHDREEHLRRRRLTYLARRALEQSAQEMDRV